MTVTRCRWLVPISCLISLVSRPWQYIAVMKYSPLSLSFAPFGLNNVHASMINSNENPAVEACHGYLIRQVSVRH